MNLIASAIRCSPLELAFDKETTPEEMIVRGAQTRSLPGCGLGTRMHVLEGLLWITQEGDVEDYVVGADDTFVCTRVGRVVVESLEGVSRFVVERVEGGAA